MKKESCTASFHNVRWISCIQHLRLVHPVWFAWYQSILCSHCTELSAIIHESVDLEGVTCHRLNHASEILACDTEETHNICVYDLCDGTNVLSRGMTGFLVISWIIWRDSFHVPHFSKIRQLPLRKVIYDNINLNNM